MKKVLIYLLILIGILVIAINIKPNDIKENFIEETKQDYNNESVNDYNIEETKQDYNNENVNNYNIEETKQDYNNENVKDYNIEVRKYNIINDNIYYTDSIFSKNTSEEEKDIIIKKLEIISEYLNENYIGKKVCIHRFSDNIMPYSENDEFLCNVYQIIEDNVILEDDYINIILENDVVDEVYSRKDSLRNNDYDIDVSKFIDIEIIKKIAYKAIDENYNKMGVSSLIGEKDYYLGHEDGITYYCFSLGSSFIKIDAQNGNIIDEYYDTGRTY